MFDLQIPYWLLNVCGGWFLGVATVVSLAAWLAWSKQKALNNALGAISVEFATEGGDGDDVKRD